MQSTGIPSSPPIESFAPPPDYRFEPELQGTPPRHVPEEFRNAPCFARQRNTLVGLLLAGALCAGFGQLNLVREWGLYLLPLAYLSWIGLGLLVLGAAGWISSKTQRGPIEYVEEGIPLVARIRELVLRPTALINGQATTYAFSAAIEYQHPEYEPLEITFSRAAAPMGIGGLILGGGLIFWLASRQARSCRELAARNERALAAGEAVELDAPKRGLFGSHGLIMTLVIGFGSLMLGGVIVLCWCFTANALLDNSKPGFRPVEIVEFWSTTHSFLFREYEIEYRFPGEQKTRKLLSTPAHMRQFRMKVGVAEVHAGRFGWSWVKDVAQLRGVAVELTIDDLAKINAAASKIPLQGMRLLEGALKMTGR